MRENVGKSARKNVRKSARKNVRQSARKRSTRKSARKKNKRTERKIAKSKRTRGSIKKRSKKMRSKKMRSRKRRSKQMRSRKRRSRKRRSTKKANYYRRSMKGGSKELEDILELAKTEDVEERLRKELGKEETYPWIELRREALMLEGLNIKPEDVANFDAGDKEDLINLIVERAGNLREPGADTARAAEEEVGDNFKIIPMQDGTFRIFIGQGLNHVGCGEICKNGREPSNLEDQTFSTKGDALREAPRIVATELPVIIKEYAKDVVQSCLAMSEELKHFDYEGIYGEAQRLSGGDDPDWVGSMEQFAKLLKRGIEVIDGWPGTQEMWGGPKDSQPTEPREGLIAVLGENPVETVNVMLEQRKAAEEAAAAGTAEKWGPEAYGVTFDEGMIGLNFSNTKAGPAIKSIAAGLPAGQTELKPGMVLVEIKGRDVSGKTEEDAFEILKSAGRPVRLVFVPGPMIEEVTFEEMGNIGVNMKPLTFPAIDSIDGDSPAKQKGLSAGMVVLEIQERDMHGKSLERVKQELTSAGRPLKLTVLHPHRESAQEQEQEEPEPAPAPEMLRPQVRAAEEPEPAQEDSAEEAPPAPPRPADDTPADVAPSLQDVPPPALPADETPVDMTPSLPNVPPPAPPRPADDTPADAPPPAPADAPPPVPSDAPPPVPSDAPPSVPGAPPPPPPLPQAEPAAGDAESEPDRDDSDDPNVRLLNAAREELAQHKARMRANAAELAVLRRKKADDAEDRELLLRIPTETRPFTMMWKKGLNAGRIEELMTKARENAKTLQSGRYPTFQENSIRRSQEDDERSFNKKMEEYVDEAFQNYYRARAQALKAGVVRDDDQSKTATTPEKALTAAEEAVNRVSDQVVKKSLLSFDLEVPEESDRSELNNRLIVSLKWAVAKEIYLLDTRNTNTESKKQELTEVVGEMQEIDVHARLLRRAGQPEVTQEETDQVIEGKQELKRDLDLAKAEEELLKNTLDPPKGRSQPRIIRTEHYFDKEVPDVTIYKPTFKSGDLGIQWDDDTWPVISNVRKGSPAARQGLRAGMTLREIRSHDRKIREATATVKAGDTRAKGELWIKKAGIPVTLVFSHQHKPIGNKGLTLDAGTIVEVIEPQPSRGEIEGQPGQWLKVRIGEEDGWIPIWAFQKEHRKQTLEDAIKMAQVKPRQKKLLKGLLMAVQEKLKSIEDTAKKEAMDRAAAARQSRLLDVPPDQLQADLVMQVSEELEEMVKKKVARAGQGK